MLNKLLAMRRCFRKSARSQTVEKAAWVKHHYRDVQSIALWERLLPALLLNGVFTPLALIGNIFTCSYAVCKVDQVFHFKYRSSGFCSTRKLYLHSHVQTRATASASTFPSSTSMQLCISTFMHLCISTSMHQCISTFMHLCTSTSMHLRTSTSMHLNIYSSTYLNIYYAFMHLNIYYAANASEPCTEVQ